MDDNQKQMVGYAVPGTGIPLRVEGDCLAADDGVSIPIVDGIPRFVNTEDYAASFGFEWSVHTDTQLDSKTGKAISKSRLERCLGASTRSFEGRTILEAGCGAGRFTEILVAAGGLVHAIDMSRAVDANRTNIGAQPNYSIAQADLLDPPFPSESFDLVLCLGVLQHTPSPEMSIKALWRMVEPGGQLVIDNYAWSLSAVTKVFDNLLRPILKRLDPARAKRITDSLVRVYFPLHWALRDRPTFQMLLTRVSPVYVYFRSFPELSREQHYEWSRLDTFDHLTDYYKRLRTVGQIRRSLELLGAEQIVVSHGGNGIEARCRKPLPAA